MWVQGISVVNTGTGFAVYNTQDFKHGREKLSMSNSTWDCTNALYKM